MTSSPHRLLANTALTRRPTAVERAAFVQVQVALDKFYLRGGEHEIAKAVFPGDRQVELLLRATKTPAMTTDADWAQPFALDMVGEFVGSLAEKRRGKTGRRRRHLFPGREKQRQIFRCAPPR
jgi:hypothetical protein